MNLTQFIENYVVRNSMLRLWIPLEDGSGNRMIHDGDTEVCMEHEILRGDCYHTKFKDYEVIGVTDILCDTYTEAINIVLRDPKSKKGRKNI